MPLRLRVNDIDKGTISRPGVCFVIVNWIVGRESQDLFLSVGGLPIAFHALSPSDRLEVEVMEKHARESVDPLFDGSTGTRPRPIAYEYGYDISVNDALLQSVRVSAPTDDVTTALVFIHDHDAGRPYLSVRGAGEESLSRTLVVGDRISIHLKSTELDA